MEDDDIPPHPSRLEREDTVSSLQFFTRCSLGRTFSSESRHRALAQDLIFDLYRSDKDDKIYVPAFFKQLADHGIRRDDPRLKSMNEAMKEAERDSGGQTTHKSLYLDRDRFKKCVGDCVGVVSKALKSKFVIPDWEYFCKEMGDIFEECRQYEAGSVATYIPQLARADPSSWAMSVCTVDGQRMSWGDATKPFCMQSVSKPFTYAIVHDEIGTDELHKYVGQEPSGRLFNEICLDYEHKPHNPLINAGAIVCASLMKRNASLSDRFDYALRQFSRFTGNGTAHIGFNNSVFLSERETADRNYALSYYMREHKCFPPNTNLQETLDLYFQLCSIETNADTMAVMAAALANGGVCPLNNERVINNRACRDTLSLMYSCGMYDWSGQFAFHVGLPAKSGVSGDMIIVVPNVMGICLFSPRLDSLGNTVRGLKFAQAFIEKYNFHNYDSLLYSEQQKTDPRKQAEVQAADNAARLFWSAKQGDMAALKKWILRGIDVHERDYDERTVLHLCASEGNDGALELLLSRWKESPEPHDRWGRTPLDDARHFGKLSTAKILENATKKFNLREND